MKKSRRSRKCNHMSKKCRKRKFGVYEEEDYEIVKRIMDNVNEIANKNEFLKEFLPYIHAILINFYKYPETLNYCKEISYINFDLDVIYNIILKYYKIPEQQNQTKLDYYINSFTNWFNEKTVQLVHQIYIEPYQYPDRDNNNNNYVKNLVDKLNDNEKKHINFLNNIVENNIPELLNNKKFIDALKSESKDEKLITIILEDDLITKQYYIPLIESIILNWYLHPDTLKEISKKYKISEHNKYVYTSTKNNYFEKLLIGTLITIILGLIFVIFQTRKKNNHKDK